MHMPTPDSTDDQIVHSVTALPDVISGNQGGAAGDNVGLNNPGNLDEELIEGLGTSDDASWGDYPIDTVLIRNETRSVHEIIRRIDQGSYIMDPDFQRDFIWPEDRQSKLIESVLMRIPLPVFYLAEDTEGHIVVVDGLQRLSTFQHFVKNRLRLKLPTQKELHGKRFEDLSPKLQNRVEDCNLILYVIDAKVPQRARLDIFERVNGGIPLTRQQMRNCLFMGTSTRFLKAEATTALFRTATGETLNPKTMRDREFVNRFCAFQLLPLSNYNDMDSFLADALKNMNGLPASTLDKLSLEFRTSLANNFLLFGRHAFRKHVPGQENRSLINASLWDVMSTGLSRYSEETVSTHADVLRTKFYQLMTDDEFNRAITLGTSQVNRVRDRFHIVEKMLREVFSAHTS